MSREVPIVTPTDHPDPDENASVFFGPPTQQWEPDRQLVDQATSAPVILSVSVEGLGGISDYSLRIEIPAYDDYLNAMERIVAMVNRAVFDLNYRNDE